MQPAFAESLEVLLSRLPSALAPTAMLPDLYRLAYLFPPVPRGGLEVHLGTSSQVDVHHGIVAGDGEPECLRTHLAVTGATVHPAWQRVEDFLGQWSDPSSRLHDEITELVLELDYAASGPELPLPSVFFGLQQEAAPASVRYDVAQIALDVLAGRSAWSPWQANVQRCFEVCSSPVFVSHIGVMLGRTMPALRINIKRLQPDNLSAFLQEVGWSGAAAESTFTRSTLDKAVAMMAWLQQFVDRITVCLDVGVQVYPQIAFECILAKQPPVETRWSVFLDHLAERGWCTAEQRDALLHWPGYTTPLTSAAAWPARFIHADLLQTPDRFTAFQRGLSHIKISCSPQQPVTAKAYLWFEHQWLQSRNPKNSPGVASDGVAVDG